MPVFTATQAMDIVRQLGPWTEPSSYRPEPILAVKGRALFETMGCITCHGAQGHAPRLPLGIPLYTFDYFRGLLEGQPTYYGTLASRREMPVFTNLTKSDMRALFSYISLETFAVPQKVEDIPLTIGDRRPLDQEIKGVWRPNGCLHCHGGTSASLSEIGRIFGGRPDVFRIVPTGKDLRIEASPRVLKRDEGGRNRLLRVLEERHLEESSKPQTDIRGMPLTMPGLSSSDLRVVKIWVQQGCPQEGQNLCQGD